jgi:hypothetical protein
LKRPSHIHAELAKMATESKDKEASRDADVYRAQGIHQKVETGQIRELEVDDATALVSVEGQILRTGVFNQRLTNETKKVTVFLRLKVWPRRFPGVMAGPNRIGGDVGQHTSVM